MGGFEHFFGEKGGYVGKRRSIFGGVFQDFQGSKSSSAKKSVYCLIMAFYQHFVRNGPSIIGGGRTKILMLAKRRGFALSEILGGRSE